MLIIAYLFIAVVSLFTWYHRMFKSTVLPFSETWKIFTISSIFFLIIFKRKLWIKVFANSKSNSSSLLKLLFVYKITNTDLIFLFIVKVKYILCFVWFLNGSTNFLNWLVYFSFIKVINVNVLIRYGVTGFFKRRVIWVWDIFNLLLIISL